MNIWQVNFLPPPLRGRAGVGGVLVRVIASESRQRMALMRRCARHREWNAEGISARRHTPPPAPPSRGGEILPPPVPPSRGGEKYQGASCS